MKHLLIIFFIAASLNSFSQKLMTKQDSIVAFNQQVKKAEDSILSKTSMRDFQLWLDENVSAKNMREGSLSFLWSSFVNVKLDEWAKKNKIVVPKN